MKTSLDAETFRVYRLIYSYCETTAHKVNLPTFHYATTTLTTHWWSLNLSALRRQKNSYIHGYNGR